MTEEQPKDHVPAPVQDKTKWEEFTSRVAFNIGNVPVSTFVVVGVVIVALIVIFFG